MSRHTFFVAILAVILAVCAACKKGEGAVTFNPRPFCFGFLIIGQVEEKLLPHINHSIGKNLAMWLAQVRHSPVESDEF
jgi:hypothetical protein